MKRAFTLVELIVVIGIIGVLMAVLLGTFSGSTESARSAKCLSNMHNLAMAVQSVGMNESYYPRASPYEYKDSDGETKKVKGWLGDQTDPYEESAETRRTCFDNGAIWDAMKHGRDSYVCPSHRRYAKEHQKGDPLWSYAMSSYFSGGASKDKRRGYRSISRTDRYLLFAEVPFAQMKVGATEIQNGDPSDTALDPVLEYGNEVIGFNHKDGRNVMGHVCFVDGHVEKLRAPADAGNIKNLTEWLCRPVVVDKNGQAKSDFDVRFNGTVYEKDDSNR